MLTLNPQPLLKLSPLCSHGSIELDAQGCHSTETTGTKAAEASAWASNISSQLASQPAASLNPKPMGT